MRAFVNADFWNYITAGAVVVGLIAALAFVVRYQIEVGFTWWRHNDGEPNHFGRFLMIRKILLSGLFLLVIVNFLTDRQWFGREMLTALLMVCFALQTFVPYRLLISAQKAQAKKEAKQ